MGEDMLKLLLFAAFFTLALGGLVGGASDVEEGVPPPWIRMVKKSSFANPEDDGVAPPWVRMVRKRQEIHPDKFGRLRLLKLQDESMMSMHENSERERRAINDHTDLGSGYLPLTRIEYQLWGLFVSSI